LETGTYKTRKTILQNTSQKSGVIPQEMKCVRKRLFCHSEQKKITFFLVHPKYGQKRPESSPAASPMHHHSQPSLGGQTTVMPAHMNSQNMQQMHQQAQQQKSQNSLQTSANNRNSEQSFAAALRSLAKQQIDIKDEDMIQQGGENKSSNNNPRASEKEIEASRQASASRGIQYDNRPTDMRNLTSPQPPEKKVIDIFNMLCILVFTDNWL
jgi:hypothetical protein